MREEPFTTAKDSLGISGMGDDLSGWSPEPQSHHGKDRRIRERRHTIYALYYDFSWKKCVL